jgi:hypothetical protein
MLLFSPVLVAQPGWHTIKDKTGSCQLSVPPNWTVLSTPGHAASPDHMDTTVAVGLRAYKPFSDETLKMLAETVFENSAERSFYLAKSSNPKALSYHVEAPGRTNACIAQISATPSTSRDDIKKIALTLSAVK